MILYISVFVITLIMSAYVGRERTAVAVPGAKTADRLFMAMIFVVLFAVSALRVNTGNDYTMYINKFHDAYYDYYVVTEPGFNMVVKGVYSFLTKENYIVVFAIFAFVTIAMFLKGIYDQADNFAYSYFFFMAFGIFFQSLNTVRNYLALALVVYSMKYVIDRKYVRFILCVLLAALFHKSALIVIPLYIAAALIHRFWQVAAVCVLFATGLIFSKQYMAIMLKLYPSYSTEEAYLMGTAVSLVNIGRCVLVLLLGIVFYRKYIKEDRAMRFYFYCNLFATLIYCCFSFVPFLSRLGYYLNITQIFLIPNLIVRMEKGRLRQIITVCAIAFGILYFAAFLYKAQDVYIKILPYRTWLNDSNIEFAPVLPISLW